MERTGKQPVLFWAALAVTGFLVNFCWESLHGLLYEAHPAMAASAYVPMMLSMAFMDTLAITGLYCLTALGSRTLFWKPDLRNSSIFFLTGLAAAYGVEYVSLSLLHLWQYGPAMPLVLGVGLFPLLQLSLTGLFSVIAARAIAVKC